MRATGHMALVAGPTTEPVSLDDVKAALKIETTTEDDLLTGYVTAAREAVSDMTGRALTLETWSLTLDGWPCSRRDDWWDGVREGAISSLSDERLLIGKAPFAAVSSVKLLDEDGVETTWASTNYYTTRHSGFGVLHPKRGIVWPTVLRDHGGIVIAFQAGYGANAVDVPGPLRHAIKLLAGHWFENRTPLSECAQGSPMQLGVDAILAPYIVRH